MYMNKLGHMHIFLHSIQWKISDTSWTTKWITIALDYHIKKKLMSISLYWYKSLNK